MHTKSQPGSLNLLHLPILLPPVIAKQRVVIIPENQPERIDSYGGKDLRKGKFKTRQETAVCFHVSIPRLQIILLVFSH